MSSPPDPQAALQAMLQAGQAMAQGVAQFMAGQQELLGKQPPAMPAVPPALAGINPAAWIPDSEQVRALQKEWAERHARLWQAMLARGQGVAESVGDKRFDDPSWAESPVFDYLRQAYLINADVLRRMAEQAPVADGKARNKLRFLTRQYVDAMAPSNFAATNPEFIRSAMETQGESIRQGITNLLGDLEKGRISMSDNAAFEVGRNLAITPGAVVFENELIQLIQYSPLTDTVARRPFLIVPPCINKYYILDLQPENSFVRYVVEQGHTVFLVSWKNVQADQGHLRWDDYLELGPLAAIDVVREVAGSEDLNALGFCVGGTILASALAVAKARGQSPVASLTLLTTLLDFSDTGEISYFVDETAVAARENTIGRGGLLSGNELNSTFAALRANDLVWQYVVGNYLKGGTPPAFDLLYWNGDATNLPGPFTAWYLRNLYLENSLRVPDKLTMCGVPADLGRVDMPAFIYASREDHIVPWKTSYLGRGVLGGETTFVLGASGHIAGVINPPAKNKRSHWTSDSAAANPDDWFASATERKGSWWPLWSAWLKRFADGDVPARGQLGCAAHPPGEAAPGRYVRQKA